MTNCLNILTLFGWRHIINQSTSSVLEDLMEYMTIQEAAALWSLSERRVQVLCSSGRIEGAAMFGRQWAIPANASKPVDARVNYRKKKVTNEIQCR